MKIVLYQCEIKNCKNDTCEHNTPHTPMKLWGKNGYQNCTDKSICGDAEYSNVKCIKI